MRSRGSDALVVLGLAGLCAVVAPARTAGAEPRATRAVAIAADDDELETKIAAALKKDSMLAPRDIDVEAKRGRVTLSGTVRTAAEKARAEQLAKISGVLSVKNEIEIDPKVDESKVDAAADKTKAGLNKAVDATVKAARKTKQGVQKGVEKSEEGVGKAADKTAEAVGSAGEELSDASITTHIKTKLADEALLKDSAIDVDTSKHVVTLKGTVASRAAKSKAAAIAAGTSGVNRVVNELVVTPQK